MSRYFITTLVVFALLIGALTVDGLWSVPRLLYIILIAGYTIISVAGMVVWRLQYYMPIRWRGRGDQQHLALTFDMGTQDISPVLDLLDQLNVPAVFFCTGADASRYPHILKRLDAAGHLLGLTDTGAGFHFLSTTQQVRRLVSAERVVEPVLGKRPRLFRSPAGVVTPVVARMVKRLNYEAIGWSETFSMSDGVTEEQIHKQVARLKSGEVIRVQDINARNVRALEQYITDACARGFSFVRIDRVWPIRPFVGRSV